MTPFALLLACQPSYDDVSSTLETTDSLLTTEDSSPTPPIDTDPPETAPEDSAPPGPDSAPSPTDTAAPTDTGQAADTADTASPIDTAPPVPPCTPYTCTLRLQGEQSIDDGLTWATHHGEKNDYAGLIVMPVGDVDGDGRADLFSAGTTPLVGPGGADPSQMAPAKLHVSIEPGEQLLEAATVNFYFEEDPALGLDGDMTVSTSGLEGHAAGDLNSDGVGDLAFINTEYYDESNSLGAGAVFVINGPVGVPGEQFNLATEPSTRLMADEINAFGESLSATDDLTDDGHGDLVVISSGYPTIAAPRIEVFEGPMPAGFQYQSIASQTMLGHLDNNALEYGNIDAADMNGDGLTDLRYSMPLFDWEGTIAVGAAAVAFGPNFDGRIVEEPEFLRHGYEFGDFYARFASLIGDTNGDGTLEHAASTAETAAPDIRVHVYDGGDVGYAAADDAPWTFLDDNDPSYGSLPGPGGDFDGDGFADLVIGTTGLRDTDEDVAYIMYGPLTEGVTLMWDAADAILSCGYEACWETGSAGDVDGDGYDDLYMGSKWDSDYAPFAGSVKVILGGWDPI